MMIELDIESIETMRKVVNLMISGNFDALEDLYKQRGGVVASEAYAGALILSKPKMLKQLSDKGFVPDKNLDSPSYPLNLAIAQDHIPAIEIMLDLKDKDNHQIFKVNNSDTIYNSLFLAAQYSGVAMIEMLMEHGAEMVTDPKSEANILYGACISGDVNMLKYICEQYDVPLVKGDWGDKDPLALAVHNHQLEMASYLIERGAEINNSPHSRGNSLMAAIHSKENTIQNIEFVMNNGGKITDSPAIAHTLTNAIATEDLQLIKHMAEHYKSMPDNSLAASNSMFIALQVGNGEITDYCEKELSAYIPSHFPEAELEPRLKAEVRKYKLLGSKLAPKAKGISGGIGRS